MCEYKQRFFNTLIKIEFLDIYWEYTYKYEDNRTSDA
jgi:hypothetical protein